MMAQTYYKYNNEKYSKSSLKSWYFYYLAILLISFIVFQLGRSPLNNLLKINVFSKYIYSIFIIFNLVLLICLLVEIIKQKGIINYIRAKRIENKITKNLIDTMTVNKKVQTSTIEVPSVKAVLTDLTDGKITVVVERLAGMDNVQSLIPNVSNALRGRLKDYAVVNYIENPNNLDFTFVLENVNENKSIKVKSINDLIVEGDYSIVLQKGLIWKMNEGPHLIVSGKTRSGKTSFFKSLIAQFFYKKIDLYIIDGKYNLSAKFPFYNKVYNDIDEIMNALREIINILEQREKDLKGNDAYNSGMKPIVVLIDEYSSIVSKLKLLDNKIKTEFENIITIIVQKGRSSGVFLICGMQNSNSETIKVAIRNQFALRILLGNSSAEDVKFIFMNNSETVTNSVESFTGFYYLDGETNQPKKFFIPDMRNFIDKPEDANRDINEQIEVNFFKELAEGRNYDN